MPRIFELWWEITGEDLWHDEKQKAEINPQRGEKNE